MSHKSLPTMPSVAGSLRTLRAAARRLSAVRLGQARLFALALAGAIGVVAAVSGAGWAHAVSHSVTRTTEISNGDTVVVYGAKRFTTPTGSSTLGMERFTIVVQPNQEYVLQLDNGAPNGSSRASTATVELNGSTVLSVADLGGARSGKKVIQALAEDTLRVTVQGSAGAYVDVSVLQTADPTLAVFGPHLFIRNTGSPTTETFTFSAPPDAAPFAMTVINGNPDGTQRAASATILLNGVQVLGPSELKPQVGGLRKQVTLQQSNTIQVQIASIPQSRLTLTFLATDVNPPVLAITTPTPRQLVRDSTVAVVGTVQDATSTTVTINGQPAGRFGSIFSGTVPLPVEGENTILISAVNAAGKRTDSSRVVIHDSQPPVVTLTSPATDNSFTNQATLTVAGTVSDITAPSVNVNGVPLALDQSGSFSGTVALDPGSNFVTIAATDAAGNETSIVRRVTLDTSAPTVTLTSPNDGLVTKARTVHVAGLAIDDSPVTVDVNGVPAIPDATGAFAIDLPLTSEGSYPILVHVSDAAGNTVTPTRQVIRDTHAPVITLASPTDGATVDAQALTVSGTIQDATTVSLSLNGAPIPVTAGAFSSTVSLAHGPNVINVIATDGAGNASSVSAGVSWGAPVPLLSDERTAPDPSLGAPALDQMRPYSVATSNAFLYSGANPIQKGVVPDSIDFVRAAVLRGQLKTRDGAILPGVDVRVVNHPELGWTTTRANGQFDLAVNGGGTVRLRFTKAGYVPAERQLQPANNGFGFVEDLVMVPLDTVVTQIDFSQPIEVAQGSVVTDSRGQRQQALFFAQGTQATMTLADGTTQPLTSLSVRATEVTVGANGRAAMSAPLPSHTAYTYAAELSIDEALAAGATTVKFSNPVISYLDNFLGFPTGVIVPTGSYDASIGAWVAEPNGRVIQIASVTAGLADVIVDSTNVPASTATLQAMGFTDDERRVLATRYAVGKTVWRTPLLHFSNVDYNARPWIPPVAKKPTPIDSTSKNKRPAKDCKSKGSIIGCEGQTLGEDLPLVGVPATLHYESDRALGTRKEALLDLTITDSIVPPGVSGIQVSYTVAGRSFFTSYSQGSIRALMRFQRDLTSVLRGTDPYGRPLPAGQYEVKGQLTYLFPINYGFPCFGDLSAWGIYSCAEFPQQVIELYGVTTPWVDTVSVWDSRSTDALGGWTLSSHHTYSAGGRRIYYGDGQTQEVNPEAFAFKRYAGTGVRGPSGDGGPATKAALAGPWTLAFGADGSLYVSDRTRIRHISRDGTIQSFGPAFVSIIKIEMGRDGWLYVFDDSFGVHKSIWKIAPDGTATMIVGGGPDANPDGTLGVDGGIGTSSFSGPFAVGPEGEVYFEDFAGLKRLGTDGRIRTIARPSFNACFGARIENVKVNTINVCYTGDGMAVGSDGSLYFVEPINGCCSGAVIRRVDPDGNLTTFGGGGTSQADGVPARQALLWAGSGKDMPSSLHFGPDGSLYFKNLNQIKRIGPDGKVWTVAGVANSDGSGKLGYPLASNFSNNGYEFGVSSDGTVFVSQGFDVYRLGLPFPSMSATDVAVFSERGSEAYIFDRSGRHLRTLNGVTGRQLLGFAYDDAGRLAAVTDDDGNTTRIERNGSGTATAIIGPFGQRSALSIDADGYLRNVTNLAGESIALDYHADGILASLTTPKLEKYSFAFDTLGRLLRDANPAGGFTALGRTTTPDGYTVTLTSAEGRTLTETTERPAGVGLRQTETDEAGLKTVMITTADGKTVTTAPNGTIRTYVVSPDDRLGSSVPVLTQENVRLPGGQQFSARASRIVSTLDAANVFATSSILDSIVLNGNAFVRRYDVATRTLTKTSAAGRKTIVTYDDKNRPVKRQRVGLAAGQATYDAHGRVDSRTRGGLTMRFDYDSVGRLRQITRPLGLTQTAEYDDANRVRKSRASGGQQVSYDYDANGNVTAITPLGRPAHLFSYDSAGLPRSYTAPQLGDTSTVVQYRFSRDQDLQTIIRPGGDSITFSYDSAGRQSGVSHASGTVTFGYGSTNGLLTRVATSGEGGTITFGYNGSLLTSASTTGVAAASLSFGYDANFRVGSMTIGGQAVAFGYDNDGLLKSVGALTIVRDSMTGLVRGSTLGTLISTVVNDSLAGVVSDSVRAPNGLVYAYHVDRDSVRRVVQRTEYVQGTQITYHYAYDSASRLREVQRDGQSVATYDYDQNGNRTTLTTASGQLLGRYDAQDRLLQYGDVTYGYTRAGERRFRAAGSDTTWYQYDALGNLLSIVLPGGKRIDYVVDGLNRRVAKKVNGTIVRRYLYQGQLGPGAELNASGQVITRYVYGVSRNSPDYMVRGGATYRLLKDDHGSIRLVVDASSGTPIQRLDYDEYGRTVFNSNPGFQPFGFAGGLSDEDQPLVRFGLRDYDPETGTWTTKDALGFDGGGTNFYQYAGGDPVNGADPSGLCPCQERAPGVPPSLDDVDPELKRRAEAFIKKAHEAGIELRLAGPVSTYRTDWQQDSLFEIGRSEDEIDLAKMGYRIDRDFDDDDENPIVTKAMEKESAHDFGYAIDLVYVDEANKQHDISSNRKNPVTKKLLDLAGHDFTWGGDFPGDPPHFQLPNWKAFKSKPCSYKP